MLILRPTSRITSKSVLCFFNKQYYPHCIAKRTLYMNNTTASLAALGVTDLAMIPSAHPDQNPLDIFRTHIAERLAPLAGVDIEAVFSGLDRSTKPETGDFVLAIPRLRIKGAKPQELGERWQAQVLLPSLNCQLMCQVWRVAIVGKGRRVRSFYAIFHLN